MLAHCAISSLPGPGKSFRILPAGAFRAGDGRPQGVSAWFLDTKGAAALIAAAKARRSNYVIDYDHQTLNAATAGGPARAAGWFSALEWREGDGLYVIDARWTDAATQLLAKREYRYVSPVFRYDADGRVVELVSAAITNTPALDGLTDLAAASVKLEGTSEAHGGANLERDRANEKLRNVFGPNAALVG
jgi:phage I-like protein